MVDQPEHCGCDRLIEIAIGECAMQIELRRKSNNSARFSGSTRCRSNGYLNPGNARG
jgi:hypothetical protein